MKTILPIVFLLLSSPVYAQFFGLGGPIVTSVVPQEQMFSIPQETSAVCVDGNCPAPVFSRSVQWSQPTVQTVAVQTPVTTMVERTVQVPVTTMQTSCVQYQTASVPMTVTRTRRVGFFGRWIAQMRSRRAARRSARAGMNFCE